jgi:RNA polymerase sigma-54 factor
VKQTLQLKLSQHLTLTPQLQQSIRLLQLSTIELNAEVERMLQENPLLEKVEGDEEPLPTAASSPASIPHRVRGAGTATRACAGRDAEARERSERPSAPTSRITRRRDGLGRQQRQRRRRGRLLPAAGRDEHAARSPAVAARRAERSAARPSARRALIDALDEDGYLHTSLEELAEMFPAELEIEPDELSIALCYLQSFEPAGVGARDAAECLALQLKALPERRRSRRGAQVVTEHLPLLAARDFTKLKRLLIPTTPACARCARS